MVGCALDTSAARVRRLSAVAVARLLAFQPCSLVTAPCADVDGGGGDVDWQHVGELLDGYDEAAHSGQFVGVEDTS